MQQKWIRTVGAFAVASAIAIQLPMRGGTGVALADTEYPNDTGGSIAEQVVTVATAATVASVVSSTTASDIGAGLFTAASVASFSQVIPESCSIFRQAYMAHVESDVAQMDTGVTVLAFTTTAAAADFESIVETQVAADISYYSTKPVIQNHVIKGRYSISQLKALAEGTTLDTLGGGTVTITNKDGLKVNGIAIPEPDGDILFAGGYIHPISGVLKPPSANDNK
ncbi:MAG: fasciclin domain-containing protein [Armatimonadota bacterium]